MLSKAVDETHYSYEMIIGQANLVCIKQDLYVTASIPTTAILVQLRLGYLYVIDDCSS